MATKYLKAIEAAEYFIDKAQKEGDKAMTPKKLQKMLYYAQAWFLVFENRKLFSEKIEAWLHGPAVYAVYQEYRQFGFLPIQKEIDNEVLKKIPESIKAFLSEIWKVYGKYDANYLEILTHSESPWKDARQGIGEFSASDSEIDTDAMKKYYKNLLSRRVKKNV